MSTRPHRHNNSLIDWRMLPLGVLSLAIGGVVSYSAGSNFGLGYVKISELPLTAGELALSEIEKTAPAAVETAPAAVETEPVVAKKPVEQPAPKPTEPKSPEPSAPVVPEAVATAPAVPVAEPEEEIIEPAIEQAIPVTEPLVAEVVTAPGIKYTEPTTNTVTQSISLDEDGNEIVKLSVDESLLPASSDVSDLNLPDTADIVARANLAAGVELSPEQPELLDTEQQSGDSEDDQDQLARFSTDPEDLPILRVIVPDSKTPEVVIEESPPEEELEFYTEATLSKKITDAVDSGVVDRVLKLIKEGEPLDGIDRSGQTMLLKAAWNGDEEMFNALLTLGANINVTSNDGRTPLFSATVSGNLSLVQKLVDLDASVNTKTKEGKTPLMVSAWSNYPEIARYLLEQGAQPDLIDNNGRNALFYALWDRNIDVIRTLIQYGARLDQVDTEGHSAVDIARLRRIELPGMDLDAESKSIN